MRTRGKTWAEKGRLSVVPEGARILVYILTPRFDSMQPQPIPCLSLHLSTCNMEITMHTSQDRCESWGMALNKPLMSIIRSSQDTEADKWHGQLCWPQLYYSGQKRTELAEEGSFFFLDVGRDLWYSGDVLFPLHLALESWTIRDGRKSRDDLALPTHSNS